MEHALKNINGLWQQRPFYFEFYFNMTWYYIWHMIDFNFAILLITFSVNGALLCMIVAKQYKNIRNHSYLAFIFSIIFLLLWTLCNYLADTALSPERALLYTRATIPCAFFMFYFIFIFSSLFPVQISRQKIISVVYFAAVLFFSSLAMTHAVIRSVSINPSIGIDNIDNSALFIPIMVLYILIFCHALFNLYKKYITLQGQKKEQVRYTLIGWSLFLFGAIVVSGVVPLFIGDARLSKLGPFFSVFMVGFTTYAILKHQFLDIRIIIQRGLIYLFLLVIIIGVYITSLQFFALALHQITNTSAIISAGIVMVLGILFFNPLEQYFRKISDPIFFKNKYNYADTLHALSKALRTNVSQVSVIASSSEILKATFKTTEVRFQLSENADMPLLSPDTEISIPIVFEGESIGLLELGPKKSGDAYDKTDRQLLETFAFQAAVALEKGRLFAKVEEYNSQLEQLVEERTLEIKKLHEDQKQAMIDISHNLQTPLAIIKAEIELLSDTAIPAEKIKMTKRAITRVSQFIRQLLHLAKLDHEGFAVELVRIDFSSFLREEMEYFEVMAAEKEIKVACSIEKDIYIHGNRRLLNELLINLISNAIKYRKRNAQENMITVSLDRENENARLIVRDNGIGIFTDDMSDVFTRFYRGSRTHSTKGTGLGLAISKKIVERHGGSISADSIPRKETSFTMLFPLL